jgi:hypothetical protein
MLALHLLQNCRVYVNTLMGPARARRADLAETHGRHRALTPLFWGHVNPHRTFRLDMTARLPLDLPTPDAAPDQFLLQGLRWSAHNRYFAPGDKNVGFGPYCTHSER